MEPKRKARQSRSFQGIVLLLVPAVAAVLQNIGVDVPESTVTQAVTSIAAIVGAVLGWHGTMRRDDIEGV